VTGTIAMYLQAMQGWPAAVAEAAAPIIERHAKAAYRDIQAGYPVVSGTLRDGLTITNETAGPMHPAWTLENTVYYAKIFEAGGATTGLFNVVDDAPAPLRDWLPYLAEAVGAKRPRRVPRWLGKLLAGEAAVAMMTEARGASNARARGELGWEPRFGDWRQGFEEGLDPRSR